MEFEAIYRLRDKIKPMLDKRGIKFTELHASNSFMYYFAEKEVQKRDGTISYGYSWCGGKCRWGTSIKTRCIRDYLKTLKGKSIIEYVGIAIDEEERIPRALEKGQVLPLVAFNMTEADALSYCHEKGFFWHEGNVELYDIMDRVSCYCCKNNNLKELRNIYLYLPQYWEKLKKMQTLTDRPYKSYRYKGNVCGTIGELEERFRDERER